MGECWEHGTATFMILGDICTRACGFCAVPSGKPVGPPDEEEPFRVAEAVARLRLRYAVVTSVNRDDQPDGGAHIFARTIEEIRRRVPGCKVEVLIPDFRGDWNALDAILVVRPDILNHNTETVPRLYRQVRKGAVYERSLELLRRSKQAHPEVPTKTGLMLGLGEEKEEVLATMQDLAAQGTKTLAHNISTVNGAIGETTRSAGAVLDASLSLSSEATRLTEEVQNFFTALRDGSFDRRAADDPDYRGSERRTERKAKAAA